MALLIWFSRSAQRRADKPGRHAHGRLSSRSIAVCQASTALCAAQFAFYHLRKTMLRGDTAMLQKADRILTTHVGSLIRPAKLIEFWRSIEDGKPFDEA